MIWIVMGVSGSGKTTVGRALAARLGGEFSDADDFHSAANKAKMAAGHPLNDADREPWLRAMRASIENWKKSTGDHVLACSALKARYREILGEAGPEQPYFYLKAEFDLIESRLKQRTGHFFDPRLLRSQYDALEEPIDAVVIDASLPVEAQVEAILRAVDR